MKKIKEKMMKMIVKAQNEVSVRANNFANDERGEAHMTSIIVFVLVVLMIGGITFGILKAAAPDIVNKVLAKFSTIFEL